MSDITIDALDKSFGRTRVLHEVSLAIASGEFIAVLGPSGCGKTTTLMSVAGLHAIDGGRIRVGDIVYTSPSEGLFLPPEKRDIGMVFQSYALWPHMSVRENVAFGLKVRKLDRAKINEEVDHG